ncbi:hypothetical protein D3C72_584380 [compost metagenome]
MGLISSFKNSVVSAVNTATKAVASGASAAVGTLNTMKKVVIDTTKKAASATMSASYYAAKTIKKYAVVPYEIAHKLGGGLTALGKATGKAAKLLGHKALHGAHHLGHVLHHKVDKLGGLAQKATVAALKKLTPLAMHGKVVSFGAKFLKATVIAPVLSGIKTAYAVKNAIAASMDPKVSSEDAKKLWVKAGVSAVETALNVGTRLSPYGLAFAVADIGTELATGKSIGDHVAKAVVG